MFKRNGISRGTNKVFKAFKEEVKFEIQNGTIDNIFFKYPRLKSLWLKIKGSKDVVQLTQGYNWGVTPAEGAWVNPKDYYLEPICQVKNLQELDIIDVDFEGNGWMDNEEDVVYHLYTYQTTKEIKDKLDNLNSKDPEKWAAPQLLKEKHLKFLENILSCWIS